MTVQPDHELEVLEIDQTVPPRPEEAIADDMRGWLGGPVQEGVGEGVEESPRVTPTLAG